MEFYQYNLDNQNKTSFIVILKDLQRTSHGKHWLSECFGAFIKLCRKTVTLSFIIGL